MDVKLSRRQCGAMLADSKTAAIRSLDRINLRLPPETFEAIDATRAVRPGNISRNTWITEAVEEKLARDRTENGELKNDGAHA
jgi:predicted HicB family RNase H-like nuclease